MRLMISLMRKKCAGLNLMRFDTDADYDADYDTNHDTNYDTNYDTDFDFRH